MSNTISKIGAAFSIICCSVDGKSKPSCAASWSHPHGRYRAMGEASSSLLLRNWQDIQLQPTT